MSMARSNCAVSRDLSRLKRAATRVVGQSDFHSLTPLYRDNPNNENCREQQCPDNPENPIVPA